MEGNWSCSYYYCNADPNREMIDDVERERDRMIWCPLVEIEPVKHSDFYPNADENGMVDVSEYPYTK